MRICPDCSEETRRGRCPECGATTYQEDDEMLVLLQRRDLNGRSPFLPVAGESQYQPALRTALKRDGRSTGVTLVTEPTNPVDPHAVRVCDFETGETFGYLQRRAAKQFHGAVERLAGQRCVAGLTGGGRGKFVGVFFDATAIRNIYDSEHAPRAPKNRRTTAIVPVEPKETRTPDIQTVALTSASPAKVSIATSRHRAWLLVSLTLATIAMFVWLLVKAS
jgi:hypothetical protein